MLKRWKPLLQQLPSTMAASNYDAGAVMQVLTQVLRRLRDAVMANGGQRGGGTMDGAVCGLWKRCLDGFWSQGSPPQQLPSFTLSLLFLSCLLCKKWNRFKLHIRPPFFLTQQNDIVFGMVLKPPNCQNWSCSFGSMVLSGSLLIF